MDRRREEDYVIIPRNETPQSVSDPREGRVMHNRFAIDRQIVASLAASLVLLSYGFHIGWPSPSLAKLMAANSTVQVTSQQSAWIVSCQPLGFLVGALCFPYLTDRWGRRTMLLVSTVPFVIGCGLLAGARAYWWFYVARLTIGFGIGTSGIVAAMYIGEMAEDTVRGSLGALLNNMTNVGLLIAYCVGPWFERSTLAGVGAAIPIIAALCVYWLPESPVYLLMKKRRTKAQESLVWLRRRDDVSAEMTKMELNVEHDQRNASSFKELLVTPANRRALLITVGLYFCQELSGYLAILSYSSLIFEASGAQLSGDISLSIIAIIQICSGFFAICLADRLGRRPLLLISTSGSIIFLSAEALYFQLLDAGVDVTPIYWLPVTAIVGFVISYTVGLGLLPSCVCVEVFPGNVRAKGIMVSIFAGGIFLFVVTQLYQIVADTFGIQYAFWMFAGITVCSTIFIYFVVPETKNRSLREIHDELDNVTRSKNDLKKPYLAELNLSSRSSE